MLQCRDFWIFGYLGDPPSLSSPFSSPFSSLFHLLPSILFHGAQDAQEDLPMMPMRLIVLMLKPASFSDPSGCGFARNCLGARIYLGMLFCGCNCSRAHNYNGKGFRLPPIFLSSLTSITQGTQGGFQGKKSSNYFPENLATVFRPRNPKA